MKGEPDAASIASKKDWNVQKGQISEMNYQDYIKK